MPSVHIENPIINSGITIRDRLRVLLPSDPENYRQRDIVPSHVMDQLGQAKILITNFHSFQLRETMSAGRLTKAMHVGRASQPVSRP